MFERWELEAVREYLSVMRREQVLYYQEDANGGKHHGTIPRTMIFWLLDRVHLL